MVKLSRGDNLGNRIKSFIILFCIYNIILCISPVAELSNSYIILESWTILHTQYP